jgi:hypothetical protein
VARAVCNHVPPPEGGEGDGPDITCSSLGGDDGQGVRASGLRRAHKRHRHISALFYPIPGHRRETVPSAMRQRNPTRGALVLS